MGQADSLLRDSGLTSLSLDTQELLIGHTGIAVTQVVCICIFVGGLIGLVLGHRKSKAC